MSQKLKDKLKPIIYPILYRKSRKKLQNSDFTIISDNCWGGRVYQELGIQYNSPFIGLFIMSPDYLKLVKDLRHYMSQELVFTDNSKYTGKVKYPIGLLSDIEIHFLHYSSEEEARSKWNRRKERMNWDNIFFKFNDNDKCNYELIKEFDNLDYKSKVIFSSKKFSDIRSLIYFKERENIGSVGEDLKIYRKYFDAVDWLNKGGERL